MRLLCLALVLVSATATARREPPKPPLSIAPLAWGMNVEVARATLELKQMAPQRDETRRYMAMTPQQPYVRHTSEPGFRYVPRTGWRGYAHFAWSATMTDYRIDHVLHSAEGLTDAQLADELAALSSTYGVPDDMRDSYRGWRRGGARLDTGFSQDEVTGRWNVWLRYTLER